MTQDFIINGKFLRASMTGVHRVAFEMCKALAELSHEAAPQLRGRHFEVWHTRTGREAARNIRLPAREVGALDGITWEQVTLPLRQGRPVLLNFCNIGPMFSANALTMIHDVQVKLSPGSYPLAFRLWYRMVQSLIARRNMALLTVSDFSRQQIALAGLAPIERIHTIHNGADHVLRAVADVSILDRLGIVDEIYTLALSTTQHHKNIEVLLKAFSRPELAGVKLVLFGAAGRADFVSAGRPVPANVIFAGRVSDGELRALVEGALALAFPSTTEGFGLPPLEAMLLGTPAICAPCGALPEVCGDAALYADPGDPEDWAEKIAALVRDVGRREQMSAAGRMHASVFTWRKAALRLLEILDTLEPKMPDLQTACPGR